MFSLISQIVVVIIFQVSALFLARQQSWFVEFDKQNPCFNNTIAEENFLRQGLDVAGCDPDDDPVASYENFAVFNLSQFQYIILIIVFSKGAPYRQSFYKNFPLIADIAVLAAFCLFLTVWPDFWTECGESFESFAPPLEHFSWRWWLMLLVAGNFIISLSCEMFISDKLLAQHVRSKPKKHSLINQELDRQHDWPPLSPDHTNFDRTRTVSSDNIVKMTDQVKIVDQAGVSPDQAFDSLFSTPVSSSQSPSHSVAAVVLNPPSPVTPRRAGAGAGGKVRGDMMLASPSKSYATAQSSPASSSVNTCNFLSCDTLDAVEDDLGLPDR